jgi:hypothetical protein
MYLLDWRNITRFKPLRFVRLYNFMWPKIQSVVFRVKMLHKYIIYQPLGFIFKKIPNKRLRFVLSDDRVQKASSKQVRKQII